MDGHIEIANITDIILNHYSSKMSLNPTRTTEELKFKQVNNKIWNLNKNALKKWNVVKTHEAHWCSSVQEY